MKLFTFIAGRFAALKENLLQDAQEGCVGAVDADAVAAPTAAGTATGAATLT